MEKSLFEQMGGTYTQVGDYLIPNLRLPEQQDQPLGVWGQRHARYLKQHHKSIYMNLLTSGKLIGYLVDIENQAKNMFLQIVKQLAESENITHAGYPPATAPRFFLRLFLQFPCTAPTAFSNAVLP